MADIILRSDQLGPLTSEQVDQNFINLNVEVGQKLDAVDYTAADVLAKLLTVDGTGSNLDADHLDGLNGHSVLPTTTDKSSVVIRDASGNFVANSITSNLIGNVTGNVTGSLTGNASTATALQTARNINGVAFDGSTNITVLDNTKLPLTGGTLSGFLTLHAQPVNAMHAATKGYVDTYGVPQGAIIMWSGTTLPEGWGLCDGTIQNSIQTPDLRERFVYGVSNLSEVKATGGEASVTTSVSGSHSHGAATANHTLTVAEIPPHTHTTTFIRDQFQGIKGNAGLGDELRDGYQNVTSNSTGGGQGHNHGISTDGEHTHVVNSVLPPYIKLAFIIKLI